jgi:membrane protease YdiL (CAAX protease family)
MMSEYKEKKSARDLIGSSLQKNNLAMSAALILVASISMLDLVLPPLGVPSALLLIWLISWLLRSSWSDLGLRRPRSWGKTITIGISVGIITQLFALFVLIPLLQKTNIEPLDYSRFKTLNGNIGMFLMYLTISWTTAGFGEELIFRGFLMGHFARLFGGKKAGWWLSLVVVSVIFALVHAYQGPMGMILIMFPAILFGIMYIMSGFNLWYTIIAHGTADTFVFLMFFTGFAEILL